jgi:hypothetical protein
VSTGNTFPEDQGQLHVGSADTSGKEDREGRRFLGGAEGGGGSLQKWVADSHFPVPPQVSRGDREEKDKGEKKPRGFSDILFSVRILWTFGSDSFPSWGDIPGLYSSVATVLCLHL